MELPKIKIESYGGTTGSIANTLDIERFSKKLETNYQTVTLYTKIDEIKEFIVKKFPEYKMFQYDNDRVLFVNDTDYINIISYDNTVRLNVVADNTITNSIVNVFKNAFKTVISYIKWVYNPHGDCVSVPLLYDRQVYDEMYPFLGDETLHSYYDRFLAASSSILLLIGQPGTGKTSFIKGFLEYKKSSAFVTYDSAVLSSDGFFARFIESSEQVLVVEDCDTFITDRKDGNDMMAKFLNAGDGLVSSAAKKIILSTNLPSLDSVDSALTRKGRCFDVLRFDEMTYTQAKKLCDKVGLPLPSNDKYTLAEIFNQDEQTNTKDCGRKIGFI